MLQDQAAQIAEMMTALQKAEFVNARGHIALGIVTLVLNAGCAILLARTAAGTLNSRFLRHLAISLAINSVNVLVSITCLMLNAGLAYFVVGKVKPDDPIAMSFYYAWDVLNSVWRGIGTIISLLCNLFLFMAWDLLRRYPDEGVTKSLFAILTACFGVGSLLAGLLTLSLIPKHVQDILWSGIHTVDLVSSAAAVLMVGWQLQKTLGPKIRKNPVLKATLPGMTLITYCIWGVPQLLHQWLKGLPWYSALLSAASIAAVIITIILCSYALEEKPEYNTDRQSGLE